jgi:hypothetical protein
MTTMLIKKKLPAEMAEMQFSQDFDLDCWKYIKAVGYAYDPLIPEAASVKYIDLSRDHPETLSRLEKEISRKYAQVMKLDTALLFKSKPFAEPIIHHDVMDESRISTVALNVPIYNTEGSYMEWWDGDYDSFILYTDNTRTVKHVHLDWKSEPVLLHRMEITRPTLVRIDIPHRAVNPQPRNRMMMSLRFSPELKFLDQ